MADLVSPDDDISALWGPLDEGALTPPPPPATAAPPANGSHNGAGNGSHGGARNGAHPAIAGAGATGHRSERDDDIARLAAAIATNRVEAVGRAEVAAVRAELEGAFTHQLAVALYELMTATNDRFAAAEGRLDQRLSEAREAGTNHMAAALESQRQASAELAHTVRSELHALRDQLTQPLEGLATFQRDLRHDLGCMNDAMAVLRAEAAAKATADSARIDRNEDRVAEAVRAGSGASAILAALRKDVQQLRQEVAELRGEVEGRRRRARGSGWRGRSR
jgi:hypothetical protein